MLGIQTKYNSYSGKSKKEYDLHFVCGDNKRNTGNSNSFKLLFQRNGSRVLHVSKNEGHAWNAAQLPMIGKEEFYSLLDMSEEMVFVHVDTPGGKGPGQLTTSN